MAAPWGSNGTVNIPNGKGTSITIHITESPSVRSEGLSLSTWGAAFVLSNVLHKLDILPPSRTQLNILELGAGTGLVGLSAAALWDRDVLLTDLPAILPGLAANIQLNKPLFDDKTISASYGTLDWTAPSSISLAPSGSTIKPDDSTRPAVILAADTFYDAEHPALVADTVRTWLARGRHSRAVFCYPLRFAYIDHIREFWELMEAGGLECVQEGRENAREEWNEVPGTEFEWCVWGWKDGVGAG